MTVALRAHTNQLYPIKSSSSYLALLFVFSNVVVRAKVMNAVGRAVQATVRPLSPPTIKFLWHLHDISLSTLQELVVADWREPVLSFHPAPFLWVLSLPNQRCNWRYVRSECAAPSVEGVAPTPGFINCSSLSGTPYYAHRKRFPALAIACGFCTRGFEYLNQIYCKGISGTLILLVCNRSKHAKNKISSALVLWMDWKLL